MTPDGELLHRYAKSHSEEAFAELVQRHLNLVYSAALRQVNGDAHLAQDVTQCVFADLARKAASLTNRSSLAGWLYTSAHFAASKAVRTEQRRHVRELEAHTMQHLHEPEPAADWEKLQPHIDAAMHQLEESDREVILLRYFQNQPHREIGERIGVAGNTARMRVERALEKLERLLKQRGVTATTASLGVLLATNAIQAAPASVLVAITSAAAVGVSSATATATVAAKTIAMTTLQKTVVGAALVVAIGGGIYQFQQAAQLREENRRLREEQIERVAELVRERDAASKQLAGVSARLAPSLPAPEVKAAESTPPGDAPATNVLSNLLSGGEVPKLTPEQIAKHLDENNRNSASLLGAYRTSKDISLLDEAMEKFPDDPNVAYEALFKPGITSEERRSWLETLKRVAPENALPGYLSALDYFKSGNADRAVQELIVADEKRGFSDYSSDRWQANEEAYRSAGYSEAETRMAAAWGLTLPQLSQLKQAGVTMIELADSYRKAGDATSAQAVLDMAIRMGQRFDGSTGTAGVPLVTQLVGIAIEQLALKAMDPNAAYGPDGGTVKDRLEELTQRRTSMSEQVKQTAPLHEKMTPQDWINYNDRIRVFGEENAMQWLLGKYGESIR
jgi:RNA polymerase sigma factor (sigma-70 family)